MNDKNDATVSYTVNGKPVTTPKHLTVREVLQAGGYDPGTHYLAEQKENGGEKEYRDLDHPLEVKEGDAFIAYYNGSTPLS